MCAEIWFKGKTHKVKFYVVPGEVALLGLPSLEGMGLITIHCETVDFPTSVTHNKQLPGISIGNFGE